MLAEAAMNDKPKTVRHDASVTWHPPSSEPSPTRSLLLPLDESEFSDRILLVAERLLTPHQGEGKAVIVHVVDPPRVSGHRERLVANARGRLEAQASTLRERGFSTSVLVSVGDPAERICGHAQEIGAGLIVMASHGRSGLARVMRGSVAEQVLRNATQPLLLCNPHALNMSKRDAPFLRILVPLDGSDLVEKILPLVEEIALTYGSEVVLLRVGDKALKPGSERHREIEIFLNGYAGRLERNGVKSIKIRSATGDPAQQIQLSIEQTRSDLVAITTHGRSGFSRLRFGSVAEEVVRSCPCPLLVVRDPGASTR
jgi:nucleotide-binding universal stress UspA family protein